MASRRDQEGKEWPALKRTEAQVAEEKRLEKERRAKEVQEDEERARVAYEHQLIESQKRRGSLARSPQTSSPVEKEIVEVGEKLASVVRSRGIVRGQDQEGGEESSDDGEEMEEELLGAKRKRVEEESPKSRGGKAKMKRTRSLEDSRISADHEDEELEEVKGGYEAVQVALKELTAAIERMRKGKQATVATLAGLTELGSDIRLACGTMRAEAAYWRGKYEGRQEAIEILKVSQGWMLEQGEQDVRQPTFADMARQRAGPLIRDGGRVKEMLGRGSVRLVPEVKTILVR